MTRQMASEGDLAPRLRELGEIVDRNVPPGAMRLQRGPIWLMRTTAPTEPVPALYMPMLCVIAQGAKELFLGDERYVYDAGRFLLNSVAVPAAGGVIEATELRPCLWIMLELDPALIGAVVLESDHAPVEPESPRRTMVATSIDAATLDAVVRLARLFETPEDFDFLSPLIQREIIYRLLQTDQAPRLRQVVRHGGRADRVVRAVEWLRDHYDRPMTIERLAEECGLSPSALHHQFKDVTAMSPLQYQKQLRLQEAKRLMVGEGLDAATAGARVGYDDPSYFSRDYRRFFGAPPRRHVARVRDVVATTGAI